MAINEAAEPRSYGVAAPAASVPDATHVGAVHLLVSDLPRAIAFYEQILGLETALRESTRAVMSVAGSRHPLVTLETRPRVVSSGRGRFGLYHFAVLLPDRAALGRFAAHLATSGMRIGMADHLVSEALYLSDPDGLGIEVYADRPRASWSHQERELAMATDPLDIHGVIAAGGGQPWSQAPAGTTLGHVHLHVGNLAAAEGFYHRGIGLEKMVWSYPGALFLAAGGYHHHLGLNTWSAGPSPGENEAKLLAWELIVPTSADASRVGRQLEAQQVAIEEDANGVHAVDPWGTRVVVRAAF